MTIFSKTAYFNSVVPLLPTLDLPSSVKALFSRRNLTHAMAGAVGSITAMTVFFPLDNARTRLQVDDKRKAKATILVLMEIAQEEGLFSLYRGLLPVLCSLFCSNFLYFYTFNGFKTVLKGKGIPPSTSLDLLFGYLAGILNVVVTTPLWVVNTRLKLQGAKFRTKNCENNKKYQGLVDGLQRIKQEEGLWALWSGTGPSLLLAGNPAIQFAVYEAIKRFLRNNGQKELTGLEYFLVGAVAKAVATVLTYPLQVAQCKQRSGQHTETGKSDIFSILEKMFRENGACGFYKGLEAKLMQTVLTAALMFATYEKIVGFIFMLTRRTKE